ncbi:hypothetical protein [Streptomyces sp. WMMC897]|uniref:hypothetical protein n=1 Tax=Streptomyces sp. WMMC897 TaxID=3014782 RepID=UPI0022B749DF|nr:hypothetical protein [Streptomyces sp. WMMC897]MCZ7415263.1 hypothetical protein [Streptomyces sp. WMMC897]
MNTRRPPLGQRLAAWRWAAPATGAGLVLGTTVATWWAVGDLSTGVRFSFSSSLLEPLVTSTAARHALGAAALVTLALSVALRSALVRWRGYDPCWWSVLTPLLLAGLTGGWSWRVLTMTTSSINLLVGFVVYLVLPFVGTLVLGAALRAAVLLRRRHRAAAALAVTTGT